MCRVASVGTCVSGCVGMEDCPGWCSSDIFYPFPFFFGGRVGVGVGGHIVFLSQGSSLRSRQGWLPSEPQGAACLCGLSTVPQIRTTTPGLHLKRGFRDLNSDPCTCTVGTFPTTVSARPLLSFPRLCLSPFSLYLLCVCGQSSCIS